MRVLLTGGAGFMGSNMVRFLLNKYPDASVVNVDKLTYAGNLDNLKDLIGDHRYAFEKADIADPEAIERIFRTHQPEIVLNYAAETHVDRSIQSPRDFIMTDVFGTFTLLEASKRHGLKKFIQISTDEVFGSTADGEFSETSPFDPSSPYSAAKAGGDHLVRSYWRTFRLPTIVTHSCNFFGPYQYPEKLIPLFITNLLENKKVPVYGAGQQVREWIYVADHCAAIDTVMTKGQAGEVYNIGTGDRLTNLEVTKKIMAQLQAGEEMIEHVADRPGHDVRYAINSAKLRTELGWSPTHTFDQGLTSTVRWYRANESWWKKIKSGQYLEYYRRQYQSGRT
ncbi:MAG: dTDP-glucose 4,6-dehydratase [Candidatus Kerfeldbacteria bacterium]|nr:dTDP-glucose 4,6-dehydratase [Candidatus Kerfeldbacteria bacterium]